MSSVGATGNNNIIQNIGTGPTEIEKKATKALSNAVKEGAKSAVQTARTVADTVTSTPEGKAITTGLLFNTFTPFPVLGDALIFGGAASAALKYLEENKGTEATQKAAADTVKTVAKAAKTVGNVLAFGPGGAAALHFLEKAGKTSESTKAAATAAQVGSAIGSALAFGPIGAAALYFLENKTGVAEEAGKRAGKAAAEVAKKAG